MHRPRPVKLIKYRPTFTNRFFSGPYTYHTYIYIQINILKWANTFIYSHKTYIWICAYIMHSYMYNMYNYIRAYTSTIVHAYIHTCLITSQTQQIHYNIALLVELLFFLLTIVSEYLFSFYPWQSSSWGHGSGRALRVAPHRGNKFRTALSESVHDGLLSLEIKTN